MTQFCMPSLGADMDEGTVLEWLVKPGDPVKKGDIVAVIDTAKSAVDVETFDTGVVRRILVQPGERVPVGTPLAEIETDSASEPAAPKIPTAKVAAPKPSTPPRAPGEAARGTMRPEPLASPVVRRFAQSSGIDLTTVQGTGPNGHITHDDVRRAMSAPSHPTPTPPPRPVPATHRGHISPYARRRAHELGVDSADIARQHGAPLRAADVEAAAAACAEPPEQAVPAVQPTTAEQATPPSGTSSPADRAAAMRTAIATLMARSKRDVPHYYLTETFDLSAARAWLRKLNDGRPVRERLVMAALLAKATAVAARRVPQLNGYWVDDAFQPARSVHLGVAVSLRAGGLVTPAIHDADSLALPDLMAALRDVVERARRGVLHRAELTDGTLTMTNLGERGAASVLGVIFPPQVALVGFGRVIDRPVAVDGLLGVHPTVEATLSGDHRASDGHVGGTFIAVVGELLDRPEDL